MSQHLYTPPPVPILMYHSVSDPARASARFRPFTVAPGLFAEHLAYLAQYCYAPLTVTQFAGLMRAPAGLPERPVVLTFDDGFADFHANAFPALRRHGFAASLYIATAFVGGTSSWLRREAETDRPMLDWDQVREISANGIECGAHTHNHLQLDTVPPAVAQDEIARSRKILEQILSTRVESFAYPFGYYTAGARRFVIAAGYTSACAVRYTFSSAGDDPFALARLPITADTTVDRLAALLARPRSPVGVAFRQSRTAVWQLFRREAALLARVTHMTQSAVRRR